MKTNTLTYAFKWLIAISILFSSICKADDSQGLFNKLLNMAQTGNAEAQYHVGMMYNNGIEVESNPKKAFEWFVKGATAGDPLASYKVGCYYAGQFSGTEPIDPEKSFQYKQIAAKAGYSLAQYDVAVHYLGNEQYSEAAPWLDAAAKQGEPMALYYLSSLYLHGDGVTKDLKKGYAYFKLAKLISEHRINPNAQNSLDELKKQMTQSEFKEAEQIVTSWKSAPSSLTIKATAGIEIAESLVN